MPDSFLALCTKPIGLGLIKFAVRLGGIFRCLVHRSAFSFEFTPKFAVRPGGIAALCIGPPSGSGCTPNSRLSNMIVQPTLKSFSAVGKRSVRTSSEIWNQI